jgi:hypothetical protein
MTLKSTESACLSLAQEAGEPVAITLDSTSVLDWLAQARQQGHFTPATLRRGVIARMIWQAAHQRSPGLIANVAYVLGWRIWGDNPRQTLAADILCLRRAFAAAGHHLAYSNEPGREGLYIRGRPTLDPKFARAIRAAVAEVDPVQMAITRRLTPAQRFAQAVSMIEFVERVGAQRLRQRHPHLSEAEALRLVRQGKVRP